MKTYSAHINICTLPKWDHYWRSTQIHLPPLTLWKNQIGINVLCPVQYKVRSLLQLNLLPAKSTANAK
eukprot:5865648-Ditylum_brightwellii.AAC.1